MRNRLHIYTAHIDPSKSHPYEDTEFVEEGFNWMAFFFTSLWALYHRLWWQAGIIMVYNFFMLQMVKSGNYTQFGITLIQLCIQIYIGFEGNDWLRMRLRKKGYITADIVAGDSETSAELRFYDRYLPKVISRPAHG